MIVAGCDNWYGDFHEVTQYKKGETQLRDEDDELEDSDSEDEELEVGEFDDDEEDDENVSDDDEY